MTPEKPPGLDESVRLHKTLSFVADITIQLRGNQPMVTLSRAELIAVLNMAVRLVEDLRK